MAKHQARPFKDFRDDDHFCNAAVQVAVCTGTCVAIKLSVGTLYTHTCSCSVVDSKDTHTHTYLKSDTSDISTQSHVPRQHPGSSKKIIISIECVHSITYSIFISILLIYFVQLLKLKRDS